MNKRFLIIFSVLTLYALSCYSQNVSSDAQLRAIVRTDGQVHVTLPSTDSRFLDYLTRNVSILSVDNKNVHISLSSLTLEWFIAQKLDYYIVNESDNKGVVSASSVKQAMEWDTYPTYSQYDSIMHSFAIRYPTLCHLETIGTTINGKLVEVLKISDNAPTDEDEPEVFYSSTIHGDETGGYIMMLRLADYLLKNYNVNSKVKNLVDNLEIWINPLANPDGTYKTGNTLTSPIRYNANGYDLNRNFPDPVTPGTVKQKETLDMMSFLRKHRFVISANFHSGAEVVNYPWDRWLYKLHADNDWFNNISRAYADTVHVYSSPAYLNDWDKGVVRGAVWYIVYGGRQDYVTSELQGREVTVEIDITFVTPAAQLALLWQNNYRSLLGYLGNALYGIHGKVVDMATSAPVPAKVFIAGHDADSSHVYSDTINGRFVRLISPGTWNLTFSSKGYKDTTLNNVIVLAGQRTDLLVKMVPAINSIDTTVPELPVLYPNPATTEIKVILPDKISGPINIRIVNQAGMLVSDYNTRVMLGVPVLLDIQTFPAGVYSVVFRSISLNTSFHSRFIVIK
jgi:hypothetical protein